MRRSTLTCAILVGLAASTMAVGQTPAEKHEEAHEQRLAGLKRHEIAHEERLAALKRHEELHEQRQAALKRDEAAAQALRAKRAQDAREEAHEAQPDKR